MTESQWLSIPELKASYQQTLRALEVSRKQLPLLSSDDKTIGEMISDCRYVVEWLNTGRRPDNRRGIERRAAYQREILTDPIILQRAAIPAVNRAERASSRLTNSERMLLEQALSVLSCREKECYEMVYGQGYSLQEAAEMLGISKSSAALYVRRAQKKITVIVDGFNARMPLDSD